MRHLSEKYCYQIGASSYRFRNEPKKNVPFTIQPSTQHTAQKLIFHIPQLRYVLMRILYRIWTNFPFPMKIMALSVCYICTRHIIAKRSRMTMTISLYSLTFSEKPLY